MIERATEAEPRSGVSGPPAFPDDLPDLATALFQVDVGRSLALFREVGGESDGAETAARLLAAAKVTRVNGRARRLFGGGASAGPVLADLLGRDGGEAFAAMISPAGDGQAREVVLRAADGRAIPGILTGTLSPAGPGGATLMIEFLDMRGVRRASPGPARDEGSLQSLFRHVPLALCRVNGDRLAGLYAGLGLDSRPAIAARLRSDRSLLQQAGELCVIEKANPQATALLGMDAGSDLSGMPIGFAWRARPDSFARTLLAGVDASQCVFETQITTLHGTVVDVLFASSMIREGGRRISVVGMMDISDRTSAEAAFGSLQADMAEASRRSAMGELSASFAHEISQPLAAIAATGSTGLRLLDQPHPRIDQARASFDRIVSYVARASGIIDRVRGVASPAAALTVPTSLGEIVVGAMRLLTKRADASGISMDLRPDPGPDRVQADLGQMVFNLVLNAIRAIDAADPAVRVVRVSVRAQAGFVECAVADSGPGIAADRIGVAFERCAEIRPTGWGTGLAACRSIIDLHDGMITARNGSPLGGAVVTFRLPSASDDNR